MPFASKSGRVRVSQNRGKHTAPVQEQPPPFTAASSRLPRAAPAGLLPPPDRLHSWRCLSPSHQPDARAVTAVGQAGKLRPGGSLWGLPRLPAFRTSPPHIPGAPFAGCHCRPQRLCIEPSLPPYTPGGCPPLCPACAPAGHEIRIGFSGHGFSLGHLGSEEVCEDRAEAPRCPPPPLQALSCGAGCSGRGQPLVTCPGPQGPSRPGAQPLTQVATRRPQGPAIPTSERRPHLPPLGPCTVQRPPGRAYLCLCFSIWIL